MNRKNNAEHVHVQVVEAFDCENLKEYKDSMLFDSGEMVAQGAFTIDGYHISVFLQVSGEVRVTYKGETYTRPSEFPEDLVSLISEHPNTWDVYSWSGEETDEEEGDIYVGNNNWFEYIYVYGETSDGFVCEETELSTATPSTILGEMLDIAIWVVEGIKDKKPEVPDKVGITPEKSDESCKKTSLIL